MSPGRGSPLEADPFPGSAFFLFKKIANRRKYLLHYNPLVIRSHHKRKTHDQLNPLTSLMSLLLPPSSSDLREKFEIGDLVDLSAIPSFPQALAACRSTVSSSKSIRSACAVCFRASGEVWLIEVGKRGAWRRLWNFGNPYGASVAA